MVWRSIRFVLAVIFAALGVMTNVTPQQAESNLSAWFSRPPQWLRSPSVDIWGEMLFFGLAMLMVVSLAWPWIQRMYYSARERDKQDKVRKFKEELSQRAAEKHAASGQSHVSKPRYASPEKAKDIDLTSATYKELGKLTVSIANDISEIVERSRYRSTPEAAFFKSELPSYFLWVYAEIRNRGHPDTDLERYFENPANIINVNHLAAKLKEIGMRLPLYIDS